jgi:HD-GYP domain-containing protein (c-di-GMP phosphodiesterase class II)
MAVYPLKQKKVKRLPEVSASAELEAQIRKLNRIGIALSNERNHKKLLELIVTEARSFTNADGGSLYIIEDDKLHFTVAQTDSLETRDGKKEPFKSFYLPLSKESIAGYVAITGDSLNIADVYELPEDVEYRVNKQFDVKNKYRSKSMLVVPMRDHTDAVIGVLQLINSMTNEGEVIPFKSEYESLGLSLASQAAVAIQNVTLIEDIKNLFRSLVRYSAKAIDARSPHTAGHSGRVARYSVRMAEAINRVTEGPLAHVSFTPQELEELRMAGWLHDIGKIGVRESVLEKTNKLTNDQLEVIRLRFENIKGSIKCRYLENQLHLEREMLSDALVSELECQKQQELDEVDDALDFICRINTPGFLEASDRERLARISRQTYVSVSGEKLPYLLEHEYEHLSIIKGNLTDQEYKEIQSHVLQTISILNKIQFTRELKNIPKYAGGHHEYLDGTGYPYGLKGDEIPIQARIMCIADIFDALTAPDRPYKQATSIEQTLSILKKEAEVGKLDRNIVELFNNPEMHTFLPPDEEE